MTGITEFLLARIEDDEKGADTATYGSRRSWVLNSGDQSVVTGAGAETPCWEVAQHIARHDPARVLAECKAKRAIIDMAQIEDHVEYVAGHAPHPPCPGYEECSEACTSAEILLALARIYADHPDYREGWAL